MIKFILIKLLSIFGNIVVGMGMLGFNLLALIIYRDREDYILGDWSIYLVCLSFGFTAFLIGRGVEYEYKKDEERALKS